MAIEYIQIKLNNVLIDAYKFNYGMVEPEDITGIVFVLYHI